MTLPVPCEPTRGLSDDDLAVLAFEASFRGSAARREAEVRERFGTSVPRHQQRLNRLLDDPAALAAEPLLVRRLRRVRELRREARSAHRLP